MPQTKFGVGYLVGVSRTDSSGAALANPQAFQFGILQEVSTDFSFESKTVYGAQQFAVDIGRGKTKLGFSCKTASIDFAAFSALHFGIPATTGFQGPAMNNAITAAATNTVVPPNAGTYVSDLGVTDLNGNRFVRVSAAPTVGQYTVTAAGVYGFATGDVGRALLVSFEYKVIGSGSTITLTNGLMGYAPDFSVMLLNDSKGQRQAINLTRCISDKLSLPMKNEDFIIADFSFEAMANAAGSVGYISTM